MICIYAPSFNSVYQALRIYPLSDIKLITRNKRIRDFAVSNGITCFYLPVELGDGIEVSEAYVLELDLFTKQFSGEKILFGFYAYGIYDLYVLHQLRLCNSVIFSLFDLVHEEVGLLSLWMLSDSGRYRFKQKLRMEKLLGLDLALFNDGRNYLVGMGVSELQKEFKTVDESQIDPEIFKQNCESILKGDKGIECDVLFIDNGYDSESYVNSVIHILNYLQENKKRVVVKKHPNVELHEDLKKFAVIDTSLPVECYGDSVKYCVIGAHSAALNHLSGQVKTISLMNLYNSKYEKWECTIKRKHLLPSVVLADNLEHALKLCLE